MRLIDAHAHIFKEITGFGARGEIRAVGGGKARWATGEIEDIIPQGCGETSFCAESFIKVMDENQIEKAVIFQGSCYGFDNYYLKEAQERHPDRLLAAAAFDPFCRTIEKLAGNLLPHFKLVQFDMDAERGILGNHQDFRLDSDLMMLIYEHLANEGKTLVFNLGSYGSKANQPDAVANIAKAFPRMKLVISHLLGPRAGMPDYLFDWNLLITKGENVYYDIAGLPGMAKREEVWKYIRHAIKLVGPEKLMWGSDAPSSLCHLTMEGLVSYAKDILTEKEACLIFHDNAERIYFSC